MLASAAMTPGTGRYLNGDPDRSQPGRDLVRQLRIRAAEHGRSAEAEHREILRPVLTGGGAQLPTRAEMAERLADFRRRVAGPRFSPRHGIARRIAGDPGPLAGGDGG